MACSIEMNSACRNQQLEGNCDEVENSARPLLLFLALWLNLCNNSDKKKHGFSCINVFQVPRELLKTWYGSQIDSSVAFGPDKPILMIKCTQALTVKR